MNEKEKETLKMLNQIEGAKRMRENKFLLVKKSHIKLFFEAHKTCSRIMLIGNPCYEQLSIMYFNPLYMEEYLTNKFMIDIIIFNRMKVR